MCVGTLSVVLLTCSISSNIREGLLESFYGVYEKDPNKVLQAMIQMGVLVPTGDMTAVRRTAQFFLNRCADEVILFFFKLPIFLLSAWKYGDADAESAVFSHDLNCEFLKRKGFLRFSHPSVSLVVTCEMCIIGTFIWVFRYQFVRWGL